MKITIKEELPTLKKVLTPGLAHRWPLVRSTAKHMPPRSLNVRIGLLISSNCRNRRIMKWKWCSFHHQTIPGRAIVLAMVWVIVRARIISLAQVDYYVSTCLLSSVLCFCIFCSFGWGKTKVVKEDFLIACRLLCSAGGICVSYDSGVITMCLPFELSIWLAFSCSGSSDKL